MQGVLNFYFPCTVTTKGVSRLRKRWERCRKHQRDFVERNGLPSTDLLDVKDYRDETEEYLNQFVCQYLPTCECECSPFATEGIKKSYHGKREDMLFSKNLSIIVSTFELSNRELNFGNAINDCSTIFNLNAENGIGVIVISIPFPYLNTDDVIFLKHIFYKRIKVTINDSLGRKKEVTTIQQYISDLIHTELRLLKIRSVDYRARYSLLELEGPNKMQYPLAREYYGMLNADESYLSTKREHLKNTFGKNLFNRYTRGYYISGTNGLILHDIRDGFDVALTKAEEKEAKKGKEYNRTEFLSDKDRNDFRDKCSSQTYDGFIDEEEEKYLKLDEIAGTRNNLFAEFVRSIEIHYLLDKALSSEIEIQKRAQLNPFKVIKRAIKLWKIIYDRAVNKYHLNGGILKAFGITRQLEEVKEEYNSLQQLIINFLLIGLSFITILVTLIQSLCK